MHVCFSHLPTSSIDNSVVFPPTETKRQMVPVGLHFHPESKMVMGGEFGERDLKEGRTWFIGHPKEWWY